VLQKLSYEVEVLGFLFDYESLYPTPPPRLPVYWVPGYRSPKIFSSTKKLLEKIDGDIIYAVKPKPTSFGVALLKKLHTRRPVILDMDDWELGWNEGDEWQYRSTPMKLAKELFKKKGLLRNYSDHPLYLKWMERLVNFADAVTVDTQFLQNRFGGTYLPNAKDTSLFDPQKFDPEVSRARYGLSGYRVLMFPGTPRPHKGLEDVLVALDQIDQPDLKLVLVGGREPDDYKNKLIERWGHRIIGLPRYPIEVMPEIVAAAHIVVVLQRDTPSARAQIPMKLTDAMALAKPILSTRVGDIPEVLGNTGYLVDSSSPEQIAEKTQWIFQHLEAANQQGKRARERCIEHYSTDAIAAILSKVISRLR
jgi:glycosyltransferase involved in cell wall biosynthesis